VLKVKMKESQPIFSSKYPVVLVPSPHEPGITSFADIYLLLYAAVDRGTMITDITPPKLDEGSGEIPVVQEAWKRDGFSRLRGLSCNGLHWFARWSASFNKGCLSLISRLGRIW